MDGLAEALVALTLLLLILIPLFLWRVWGFFARHPIIKLLFGSTFVLHISEELEDGSYEERRVLFQVEHRKK